MSTQPAETLGFQTEVKQLLHLIIHCMYGKKEIFLRELISNAADAADKLRFKGLTDPRLFEENTKLEVRVSFDKDAGTITISDNGIGMDRQEVIENLGTIAKSGTREFLKSLTGDQAKDAQVIGQFGVGFYSSFIVADKVTVLTRRAGLAPEEGVSWESTGEGEYTINPVTKQSRGTDIILHLKKGEEEFLDDWRLRHIITKYSDHITLPVIMKKITPAAGENDEAAPQTEEYETVNHATALWTLPKNEITDHDYNELYKYIAHDFEDPLAWAHNRVEGKQEYISLLFLPSRAPFDLWNRDRSQGLKLYVRRVFIMDDAEQFMPLYLRFIKGIIDSNDLPLNVSREILQSNKQIDTMRTALTKRVLGMLEKLAEEDPEKYQKFWSQFGQVMKEGPGEDFANKDQIATLLRFASTHTGHAEQTVSLKEYVSRMSDKQDKIYYITAETYAAAKHSPHMEIFDKKGIEVLLLSDRVDEWLVSHLTEFDGKPLQSIAKGALDVNKIDETQTEEEQKKIADDFSGLMTQIQTVLGDKIKEARVTYRLTNSPACLVVDDMDINSQMQRILKAAGQAIPTSKPIFELNPEHPLVIRLKQEQNDDRFAEWTHILFEQALLAEGGQLDDPAEFVQRLNRLLLALTK